MTNIFIKVLRRTQKIDPSSTYDLTLLKPSQNKKGRKIFYVAALKIPSKELQF